MAHRLTLVLILSSILVTTGVSHGAPDCGRKWYEVQLSLSNLFSAITVTGAALAFGMSVKKKRAYEKAIRDVDGVLDHTELLTLDGKKHDGLYDLIAENWARRLVGFEWKLASPRTPMYVEAFHNKRSKKEVAELQGVLAAQRVLSKDKGVPLPKWVDAISEKSSNGGDFGIQDLKNIKQGISDIIEAHRQLNRGQSLLEIRAALRIAGEYAAGKRNGSLDSTNLEDRDRAQTGLLGFEYLREKNVSAETLDDLTERDYMNSRVDLVAMARRSHGEWNPKEPFPDEVLAAAERLGGVIHRHRSAREERDGVRLTFRQALDELIEKKETQ